MRVNYRNNIALASKESPVAFALHVPPWAAAPAPGWSEFKEERWSYASKKGVNLEWRDRMR